MPPDLRAPQHRPLSPDLVSLCARAGLADLLEAVEAGQRLSFEDGQRLYAAPLDAVGGLADRVRQRLHGDVAWYNRNLHVNATNVCEASCIFCSFARLETGDPSAWTMTMEQAVGRVRALSDVLVTEVHIVNGLNPDLPFDYYTELMRRLKAERPDLHIKGYTAVEIHYYAEKYGLSYEQVLDAFTAAGLGSMPGGGAEIFAERARRKLCHDKVDADGWLAVHRAAHRRGLHTNCTLLFGSIETTDERVDHLLRLRALQDESLALPAGGGSFQTFIPLRFHNENNRLERLRAPTHADSLRTIAVSRLLLDNIPHIKAYWPMLGEDTAQLALSFGADDLDGTVREEHIYHMAGASTPQGLPRAALLRLIEEAGRRPVERDTLYRVVSGHGWDGPPLATPADVPRVGAVGYRNAWPLTRLLGEEGPLALREGHPSEVARWLDAGEVDLALLPVGALLEDPSLRVVPEVCVGCDGPVESVLLVAEEPPERWSRVVLDGVSRTSVLLARLLLAEGPLAGRVPPGLEVVHGAPGGGVEAARGGVAAVVIGDVARALPERLAVRLDLGALWKEWTGLPFVFAVWAGRPDVDPRVVDRVRCAGRAGVDAVRAWAAGQAPLPPALADLTPADAPYLAGAVRHDLDDAAMMGLRRFAALAHRAGLVAHEGVALYPPPADLPDRDGRDRARALLASGAPVHDDLPLLWRHAPLADLLAAAARRAPGAVRYRVGEAEGPAPMRLEPEEAALPALATATGPVQVGRRPTDSAARWLRLVALARLSLPQGAALRVDPAEVGLAATAAAALAGADDLGGIAALEVEGAAGFEEALVELERAIADAGRTPARVEGERVVDRAALEGAGRRRPVAPAPAK